MSKMIKMTGVPKARKSAPPPDFKGTLSLGTPEQFRIDQLETELQRARVLIASMYIQKDGWNDRIKEEVKKLML